MSRESDLYDAHQRERWLRPDAHLWVRPDAARFYLPGTDLADVIPALARQRNIARAAEAKAIAREIEALEALRDELMQVKAELARRRLQDETKYSPSQPRVPAGNPRGGQWTDRSGGQGTVAGPIQDAGQSQDADQSQNADLTLPMGNADLGDVSGSSELGDLFKIKPDAPRTDAGNLSDSIVKVAASDDPRFYTPILEEEDDNGGHTLRRHNERSDSSLIDWLNSKWKRVQTGNLEITEYPIAEGTFRSREEANDLCQSGAQAEHRHGRPGCRGQTQGCHAPGTVRICNGQGSLQAERRLRSLYPPHL
jgi:hypothetical protein